MYHAGQHTHVLYSDRRIAREFSAHAATGINRSQGAIEHDFSRRSYSINETLYFDSIKLKIVGRILFIRILF